ncbi:MAG: ThuA domain-containing protein [Arcticibacter sp.]
MPNRRYFFISTLLLSASVLFISASNFTKRETRILVFFKTAGFYHKSIPIGIRAIQELGRKNQFEVDTTANSSVFSSSTLHQYDAVVFLNTTGDIMDDAEQTGFEKYIRSGKGFVGIHAATDTEYTWPWYNKLVGAYFSNHPHIQPATIQVINKKHISTKFLPASWKRTDEWYNFKSISPDIKVLANLDESSYSGGKNGSHHPIAWYHEFDGGRAFYTGGGHTDESYTEPLFLKHILGGIRYATAK